MDIAQSMRAIYPIKDLTIERFVQSLERVKYSKGTRIIEQGNKSSYLYLIIDGVIRCLHENGEKEPPYYSA